MKAKFNSVNSAGIPSPEISYTAGGGINLSWDSPHFSGRTSEQILGFVVQWQCTLLQVQWKRIETNSVYIPGKINPPKSAHIPNSILKCVLIELTSCIYGILMQM